MKQLLGNIGSRTPLAYAEAAIVTIEEFGYNTQARFALTCGADRRLYLRRHNANNRIDQSEWIATFNRKSDPDWLAEEIAAVRYPDSTGLRL